MKSQLALVSSFRRRMLPLVGVAGLVIALAAPAAFYAQKRGELVGAARADAARAGRVLLEAVRERPRLWRYDAAKLSERLAAEGLLKQAAVIVRDASGVEVPLGLAAPAAERPLLWARQPVFDSGRPVATLWLAADGAPLRAATLELGLAFAVLALLLGGVLYLLPLRMLAAAEERIAALMGRLAITLQEDDRRRIARDLHDGAGQALTAARLRVTALRKRVDPDTVDAIAAHLDEALDEIRRSTSALLPPALADLGLAGAVERHCRSFGEAAGLAVECELVALPPLPVPVEIACYRIVQEALNNTARHAGAKRAWVRLSSGAGRLQLQIGDDGVGLGGGAGDERLASIRERARLVGGTVALEGAAGVRLSVEVPL